MLSSQHSTFYDETVTYELWPWLSDLWLSWKVISKCDLGQTVTPLHGLLVMVYITCTNRNIATKRHSRWTEIESWIGLSSVLCPRQHNIAYMGHGFYRSKNPTNSIKVIKEKCYKGKPRKCKQQNTHKYDQYMLKRYNTYNTQQVTRSTLVQWGD